MGKSARQSQAVNNKFDSTTGKADTSTAEAGTDDTQWMSPLKSLQQVQQFGLGGTNQISNTTNANDLTLGSFVQLEGVSTDLEALNYPPLGIDPTDFASFNVLTFGVTTRATQIAVENFGQGGKPDGRMFLRVLHDIWEPWQEIYTSAVLNVNEFNFPNASASVGSGTAFEATATSITKDVVLAGDPSSISVTGTFTLVEGSGITTVASGIVPALSGRSNKKTLVLDIRGLTGLTVGNTYTLLSEGNAKITVNV